MGRSMNVLVAYASQHGSTGEVAQFIGDVLKEHDINVTVMPVEQVQSVADYDAFVLGSPIYGGMWLTGLSQFIEKFKVELAAKPVHLWIMCIRVLGSRRPATCPAGICLPAHFE